jgi:RNA polymerase sigma-70 factor, ECF subfamily
LAPASPGRPGTASVSSPWSFLRIDQPGQASNPRMHFSQSETIQVLPRALGLPVTAPLTELSDETLLVRYSHGDEAAFALLVRRYERPLFTFALRYVRAREPARELTQEAFLRVVRRCREFRKDARFSTWVFSILRNLCIDELRRSKHRRHASIEDDHGSPGTALVDRLEGDSPDLDPERSLHRSTFTRDLDEALASLPADQLEVFLLREVGGLPFREIALATETPENTVKSRMRYALERLQQALIQHGDTVKASR